MNLEDQSIQPTLNLSNVKRYEKHFICSICKDIFKKPITIACGHSFCYLCIYKFMKESDKKISLQDIKQQNEMPLPLCPICHTIIWRPIKSYQQNKVLSNLMNKFKFLPRLKVKNEVYEEHIENASHQILIHCKSMRSYPMPFCFTNIEFSTAFMNEIVEQQAQQNYVILRWPDAPEKVGLKGQLIRPQTIYTFSKLDLHHTLYKAIFYGISFVKINKQKSLLLQIHKQSNHINTSLLEMHSSEKSNLVICSTDQTHSAHIRRLEDFQSFFKVYDRLNNIHYIRQIYSLVSDRVFLERNNPEAIMYGILKVLKLSEKQKKKVVELQDDELRLQKINDFLAVHEKSAINDVIQVRIPGNYPSSLVFFIFIIVGYLLYNPE